MLLNKCIEDSLDTSFPFFLGDDLVADVLSLMQKKGVECAPLLHEGKVAAMVTILDLLPAQQSRKRLMELKLEHACSVGLHEHLFEIVVRMDSFPYQLIPVSGEGGDYVGVIQKAALFEHIATVFHLREECMTLELDVPSYDLKLSEIIATLEKNDATVLSCGIYPAALDGEGLVLTFRLQIHDFYRLVSNLKKYGYMIRYTSPFSEKDDEMREKALEFIRFMDM
ncbi:MAG: CBS domain-containing protein [Chlorobiaceae bacterium]|jgi:CBS domain-containing protein